MKSRVYIRQCGEYEYTAVMAAVSKIFEDAGGVRALFRRDSRILLKPNVISPVKPEKCATTHPLVLKAVIERLKEVTDNISVGDSPAVGNAKSVLERSDIFPVLVETGARLADFDTPVAVSHPAGVVMKHFEIAAACTDFDHFISIPKLKTHCHLNFTGALKNQYGVIPGLRKARGHMQYNTKDKFANMLVDINTFLKPDFAIMDAVYGIEGDGLKDSSPRKIGLIMGSADLVALDSTACRIISLDPSRIPVVKEAYQRNFGALHPGDIEQTGGNHEDFTVKDFRTVKTDRSLEHLRSVPLPLRKMIYDSIIRKPHFDNAKCLKCGNCVKICPAEPKALAMDKNGISIDYDKCVKCYCCREACEYDAVFLKPGILGRMLKL